MGWKPPKTEGRKSMRTLRVALAQKILMRAPVETCHRASQSDAEPDPTSVLPDVVCRRGQTA